jgi:hypothetical protein
MCEKNRYFIADVPCEICVVENCENRGLKNIHGCDYGKPSNKMIRWAFEYTNTLRALGIKVHA